MQTDAARKLIQDTFERPFNEDQFRTFITNFLNKLEPAPFPRPQSGQFIYADYRDYISSYNRVGKYEDSEGHRLDVLIVHLAKNTTLERARSAQRTFIAKYLKEGRGGQMKDAALVAFVSPDEEDWRFSFVKMEYKIETTDKGRVRAKEEFTPAKRYSFLVGKNENSHTAQGQLLPILQDTEHNPTLKEIEDKFSVEKVTKEFFEKYRELFLEIKEALDNLVKKDKAIKADFASKGVETIDFAKKLLGQIVFLYFLQKKGWFGVSRNASWGTGPKNFLRLLYERKLADYDNFFNDTLESLFYEALASEREADYYSKFKCKVPFLNGGLFDPINNYDWVHTDIFLPNKLFSNKEKTKQGDVGTGILDVFDRYNFTVKEDEPLEKEVAVDPEMLGKVFENLLEVKDRKSKGTYYTPREIIHYMCQGSLISYLATELEGIVNHCDIEILVKHGETALDNDIRVLEAGRETADYSFKLPDSTRDHTDLIDQKLADIKVCDPAVGSGAFLVGMMTEIIRTRSILTEFLSKSEGRSAYNLKRHAIQNSLYGVDIDPGAVEIAKLRLWLSLIVDEDDYRQIKPLPNLDYKIMQGNSLLEEYEGVKLIDERFFAKAEDKDAIRKSLQDSQRDLQREYFELHSNRQLTPVKEFELKKRLDETKKQLASVDKPTGNDPDSLSIFGKSNVQTKAENLLKLHEEFFEASYKRKKDEIKRQIDKLTWDLIEATLKQEGKIDKIAELKQFQKTNARPFFLWKLNFAEIFSSHRGFDVVIGNPPYISYYSRQAHEIDQVTRDYYLNNYAFLKNTNKKSVNSIMFFLERAISILSDDNYFVYIIDIGFFEKVYKQIRNYISKFNILEIVTGISAFESVASGQLIILGQKKYVHDFKCNVKKDFVNTGRYLSRDEFVEDTINISFKNKGFEYLHGIISLGDICDVTCGLEFGALRNLFTSDEKKNDKYHKVINGGINIPQKYYLNWDRNRDGYVLFDKEYEDRLTKKQLNISKSGKTVHFISGNEDKYLENKIFIRQSAFEIIAVYDDRQYYALRSLFVCNQRDIKYDLKFILALLNSRFITAYCQLNGIIRYVKGKQPQIRVDGLKKIPIKETRDQGDIIKIVDKILPITNCVDYLINSKKKEKVQEYQVQIDRLVYKLYNLKPQEIAVAEKINEE